MNKIKAANKSTNKTIFSSINACFRCISEYIRIQMVKNMQPFYHVKLFTSLVHSRRLSFKTSPSWHVAQRRLVGTITFEIYASSACL